MSNLGGRRVLDLDWVESWARRVNEEWPAPLCLHAVCAEVEEHRSASGCGSRRLFAGNIASHHRAGKFHGQLWSGQRGTASRMINRREK